MPACCSAFECTADQQFNEKKATEELKRYRTKGPGPTTRLLQEVLAHAGTLRGTLLDIGSGIGSLTFRLLERGITRMSMDRRSTRFRTSSPGSNAVSRVSESPLRYDWPLTHNCLYAAHRRHATRPVRDHRPAWERRDGRGLSST